MRQNVAPHLMKYTKKQSVIYPTCFSLQKTNRIAPLRRMNEDYSFIFGDVLLWPDLLPISLHSRIEASMHLLYEFQERLANPIL